MYNFKNTYCRDNVNIENNTNTDEKNKTFAGENLHVRLFLPLSFLLLIKCSCFTSSQQGISSISTLLIPSDSLQARLQLNAIPVESHDVLFCDWFKTIVMHANFDCYTVLGTR